MAITLTEAKELKRGDLLYHVTNRNSDSTPQRWKVTSIKTWKTRPEEIEIGLKHGLKSFDRIREYDLDLVCLNELEAMTVEELQREIAKLEKRWNRLEKQLEDLPLDSDGIITQQQYIDNEIDRLTNELEKRD